MRLPSRDDISDTTWKWRYKIFSMCHNPDKALSDKSTDLSSIDDPKAPATTAKDPTFGAEAVIKTFYEGKNSSPDHFDWVDYPPKQLSKSAAKAQDRVAIKVYKIKDGDKPVISGRFALKYHMIEIQNPTLVAALKPILEKENVHLEVTETATFKEPFRPLFFCYDDIFALHKKSDDGDAVKQHLGLLIRVMNDMFGETKLRLKHLRASNLISYKLAWTYFPKDSIVYSWGTNCEVLCKVVDTQYCQTQCGVFLAIKCKMIDFDGEAFTWRNTTLEIPKFEGNKPITDLPHYPLSFHKDQEDVKARLSARGRKVLDFQGLTYCTYAGIGILQEGKVIEKHNVDSRILIDIVGYKKHQLKQGSRESKGPEVLKDRITPLEELYDDEDESVYGSDAPPPPPPPPPPSYSVDVGALIPATDKAKKSSSVKRLSDVQMKNNKAFMLERKNELFFMSPLLEGYALKNKLWLTFFVDDITPMTWNDEAYDHLVYDEQQKDLVLSFVENHRRTNVTLEDVIVGKGQGLVILLSGPPGTGKTLTAEAVADRTRRPLFYLQAEDLGVNPATLGANIKKVFEMATEWDAVILLDEADVFMAERNPNDIARNELVSIFLRELEYYRGIIFLTTNLYDTIDTAFRSRVNIHLLFNPLGPEARLVLWKKFLDRLPPPTASKAEQAQAEAGEEVGGRGLNISEDDLKELARWQLNGREIKNAIKMVQSWCCSKEYEMSLMRLESGIKVTSPHASRRDFEDNLELYE